jgi:DNA repair photolyase
VKTNIPHILSKELKKKKSGVVGISTVTDPYQPVEKKYKLTQFCLEQLLTHNWPICIQTKSDLILRDQNIISRFSNAEIIVSIGTLNDSERKIIEPCTSSIEDRLEILKTFSDSEVKTTVFFGPIYPTIKPRDILEIIDIFIENGVKEIIIDKLNLKPGILENIRNIFPSFYSIIINNSSYYNELCDEINSVCKSKNIKLIPAFN